MDKLDVASLTTLLLPLEGAKVGSEVALDTLPANASLPGLTDFFLELFLRRWVPLVLLLVVVVMTGGGAGGGLDEVGALVGWLG